MTSLFDKLGQHIDITAGRNAEAPMHPPNTPATKTPELKEAVQSNDLTGMKFTHSLIKQTSALILEEKESYFNPGNSNVTESF